jgi:hypothetical protein
MSSLDFDVAVPAIEARQFSYVTIVLSNPLEFADFVIFDPSKPSALETATAFAKRNFGERFNKVLVYPRAYVKNARKLAAEGRVIA